MESSEIEEEEKEIWTPEYLIFRSKHRIHKPERPVAANQYTGCYFTKFLKRLTRSRNK